MAVSKARYVARRIGILVVLGVAVSGFFLNGQVADATSTKGQLNHYVVHSGDTLWAIAAHEAPQADQREYVSKLVDLNALTSSVLVPGQQLLGLTSLQIGAERVDSNRLTFAMTAARPGGRGTTVQWQLGDVQVAGRPGGNSQLRLNMDLPSGIWMEVTDRGPWQAVNKALAATSTRFEVPKVFVMADEAK